MTTYRAEVQSTKVSGNFDLRRLYPDSYADTVEEFRQRGVSLPSIDDLKLKTEKDYWLLLSPVSIAITFTAPELGTALYIYHPGYITDLASVPPALRGFTDDDAREVIPAAFVHDVNFDSHTCAFLPADRIFRGMIRKTGGSWWESFKYFIGVLSPVGYWDYNHPDATRSKWAMNNVSVIWPEAKLAS